MKITSKKRKVCDIINNIILGMVLLFIIGYLDAFPLLTVSYKLTLGTLIITALIFSLLNTYREYSRVK